MTEVEAAYVAGLFDGEGWVTISYSSDKDKHQSSIGLAGTEESQIDWLISLYGGNKYVRPTKTGRNHKTIYVWQIGKKELKSFLESIRPYLRIKLSQLELLSEFYSLGSTRPSQEARDRRYDIYEEIRSINRRGVDHE